MARSERVGSFLFARQSIRLLARQVSLIILHGSVSVRWTIDGSYCILHTAYCTGQPVKSDGRTVYTAYYILHTGWVSQYQVDDGRIILYGSVLKAVQCGAGSRVE